MITREDYYRKAHLYLESASGRKDIIDLLKFELEMGLKQKNFSKINSAICDFKNYIKKDSFLYIDDSVSNRYTLNQKKDEIKKDFLTGLGEASEDVFRAWAALPSLDFIFNPAYLLAGFAHEISGFSAGKYGGLLLLLFQTNLRIDALYETSLAGVSNPDLEKKIRKNRKDAEDLAEVLIRGNIKFDSIETCKPFLAGSSKTFPGVFKLADSLNNGKSTKLSIDYAKSLRSELAAMKSGGNFNVETFAPIVFTDNLFFLFDRDEFFKGFIGQTFLDKKDEIGNFVVRRSADLFKDSPGHDKLKFESLILQAMEGKAKILNEAGYRCLLPPQVLTDLAGISDSLSKEMEAELFGQFNEWVLHFESLGTRPDFVAKLREIMGEFDSNGNAG